LENHETGIKVDEQGAIVCDPFLQSSVKDIYAAGDVCSFPYWYTGKRTRVEHWINALD
jgi:3-phenylpropionate/trans-cinnamate dioxygenase ferredoxin reductase subunit